MAFGIIQRNDGTSDNGSSSITVRYDTATTTTGTLLIAWIYNYQSATISSVTCDAGNTWTEVAAAGANGVNGVHIYYCTNIAGTALHDVIVQYSGNCHKAVAIYEFSSAGNLQLHGGNTTAGTSTTPSTTITLCGAGSLAFGGCRASDYMPVAGALYTLGESSQAYFYEASEYDLSTAAGSVAVNFTLAGSSSWRVNAAVFTDVLSTTPLTPSGIADNINVD